MFANFSTKEKQTKKKKKKKKLKKQNKKTKTKLGVSPYNVLFNFPKLKPLKISYHRNIMPMCYRQFLW